ncbi:hypothetical protein FKP32DRAFT_935080 [Trametes sanguinea]|nr:hypothetical protein FKP32DRAFT_935080 [Trametes sanguinea]
MSARTRCRGLQRSPDGEAAKSELEDAMCKNQKNRKIAQSEVLPIRGTIFHIHACLPLPPLLKTTRTLTRSYLAPPFAVASVDSSNPTHSRSSIISPSPSIASSSLSPVPFRFLCITSIVGYTPPDARPPLTRMRAAPSAAGPPVVHTLAESPWVRICSRIRRLKPSV